MQRGSLKALRFSLITEDKQETRVKPLIQTGSDKRGCEMHSSESININQTNKSHIPKEGKDQLAS